MCFSHSFQYFARKTSLVMAILVIMKNTREERRKETKQRRGTDGEEEWERKKKEKTKIKKKAEGERKGEQTSRVGLQTFEFTFLSLKSNLLLLFEDL